MFRDFLPSGYFPRNKKNIRHISLSRQICHAQTNGERIFIRRKRIVWTEKNLATSKLETIEFENRFPASKTPFC